MGDRPADVFDLWSAFHRAGGGDGAASRRIYLASSWRNPAQPEAVECLRAAGHEVYDFRHPTADTPGFAWEDVDPAWQDWSSRQYIRALQHPHAREGFRRDFVAMLWANTFVLLLPCGRSAHLEAGWAVGSGRDLIIVHPEGEPPELMAAMAMAIVPTIPDVLPLLADSNRSATQDRGTGFRA